MTQGRPDASGDDGVELDDRPGIGQLGVEEPLEVVTDQYAAAGPPQSTREIIAHRQALRSPLEPDIPAPRIGATGRRWLSVQAKTEGTWRYELAYAPAHEPNAPAVATFFVEATVHPTPSVAHARALLASAAFEDAPAVDPSSS